MIKESCSTEARCSECPLLLHRLAGPVPATIRPGQPALIVDAPSQTDGKNSILLSDGSGLFLNILLEHVGIPPLGVSKIPLVSCVPPGKSLEQFERRLRAGELRPTEACAPRFQADLRRAQAQNLIPLGSMPTKTLLQARGPLERYRGRVFTVGERKIAPTYDPGAVLLRDSTPKRPVLLVDLARARRFFADQLHWPEPQFFYRPSVATIREALSPQNTFLLEGMRAQVWDVETNHAPATRARLYCAGVGTPDWALNIPLTDSEGQEFYTSAELEEIREILREWARNPEITKVGWNSGVFDRMVFEATLGVTPTPYLDAMLLKKSTSPSLPHDLGFSASIYLDVRNWKADFWGKTEPAPEERWEYNLKDVVVTGRLAQILVEEIGQRDQWRCVQVDHLSQCAGVEMHRVGMLVDQAERQRLEASLISENPLTLWKFPVQRNGTPGPKNEQIYLSQGKIHAYLKKAQTIVAAEDAGLLRDIPTKSCEEEDSDGRSQEEVEQGWILPNILPDEEFNPLSHQQLRRILFDRWELPIPTTLRPKEYLTASGEVSTSDAVLRTLLVSAPLKPWQREFIDTIRLARRLSKLYGTYLRPFRPRIGDKKLDKGSVCWEDNRLHPSWNIHTPITGRFSSSQPNVQNMTAKIKQVIVAGEGNILIGGDQDQLELRIAAARWRATAYLDAFAKGLDPHQMTMAIVFGHDLTMRFQGAPDVFGKKTFKKDSQFESMRKLAKAVQYAAQYGASLQTVFRLITAAEDKETGKLLFAHLTLDEVARMYENWRRNCPEFRRGWAADQEIIRRQGWIAEPIHGRRRDFLEPGSNLSEEVNFCIQASAASLMNDCLQELREDLPFDPQRGIGLINQCHDSITIEVPERDQARWINRLTKVLNRSYTCLPGVTFASEIKAAWRWGDT